MKVSIVTVNFNQPIVTEELLTTIPRSPDVEIIVVDNGSSEDHTLLWQHKFPDVKFIRSEVNLGFAGGNNLGITAATGEYLFLVNNDTEFTPNLLGQLISILDAHPEAGIISPKIKYYNDKNIIQYAGYTPINYYTCRNRCIGLKEKDIGQYEHNTGQTAYCHGAAMMVRRAAVDKAGLMHEGFFLYYEELDWCERIKKAGYQAWICTEALIYHKESVSVGKNSRLKAYFMNRNRILFIRRNAPWFKRIVFYLYFIVLVAPRNIIGYLKAKNYAYIPTFFNALWWNFSHNKNSKNLGYR